MPELLDLLLHVDTYLLDLVATYGVWIYAILFVIVFAETGLIVTPFLPGDSLLFAAGALAASGALDIRFTVVLLLVAAVAGDAVNYSVGRAAGTRVIRLAETDPRWRRWINPAYLAQAHAFFERHGGKAVVLGDYVPVRTAVGHTNGCRLDLAAFQPRKPVDDPFPLATEPAGVGDSVYLVVSGHMPIPARVTPDQHDCLTYVFEDPVDLTGLAGSPMVNAEGQVVGVHLGGGFTYDKIYGVANPTDAVVVNLPDELTGRPADPGFTPPTIELEERPVLLWRVSRGDAVSHVYGECLGASLPAAYATLPQQARTVGTEMQPGGEGLDQLAMVWRAEGDPPLPDLLEPAVWNRLNRRVVDSFPATILRRLQPWGGLLLAELADTNPAEVLEPTGAAQASWHLETAEQMAAWLREHQDLVLRHLGSADDARVSDEASTYAREQACWRGDTGPMDEFSGSDLDPGWQGPILATRVSNWMKHLLPQLEQGGVFLSLTADSTMGPSGLLAALEGQGFTVEQLRSEVEVRSTLEASEPGAASPVADERDLEERIAHWSAMLTEVIEPAVCRGPSPIGACIYDGASCSAEIAADVTACVSQRAASLTHIGKDLPPHLRASIQQCSALGASMEALIRDSFAEGEVCDAMEAGLRTAMGLDDSDG